MTASAFDNTMKRYNFDRYRGGILMAQGVAVHASNLEEATVKATRLLLDQRDAIDFEEIKRGERDTLKFTDNRPCPKQVRCTLCL